MSSAKVELGTFANGSSSDKKVEVHWLMDIHQVLQLKVEVGTLANGSTSEKEFQLK